MAPRVTEIILVEELLPRAADHLVQGRLSLIDDFPELLGGGLAAFGSGAYVYGRADTYPTSDQKEAREYLDRLPPLTGRVGVRYRHECGLGLEGRVTMADKADRLSTRDRSDIQRIPPGGTPGYAVIDLSASYPVTDFALVTLALENLTDRAYRVHGSGQNEPGRNLSLTLVLRF